MKIRLLPQHSIQRAQVTLFFPNEPTSPVLSQKFHISPLGSIQNKIQFTTWLRTLSYPSSRLTAGFLSCLLVITGIWNTFHTVYLPFLFSSLSSVCRPKLQSLPAGWIYRLRSGQPNTADVALQYHPGSTLITSLDDGQVAARILP